jgi:hypothetical protein
MNDEIRMMNDETNPKLGATYRNRMLRHSSFVIPLTFVI